MAKYNYSEPKAVEQSDSVEEAVKITVINYFYHQLGWSREECEKRVKKELEREIPKSLFDGMERRRSWDFSDARLLDVGAGQGGAVLEALLRGADAHGVEPGEEFAELSRMRLQNAEFDPNRIHQTGGEDLPFQQETFDYVISLQVLEHVRDPMSLMEEIYRVLKPGGEARIRCENYLSFRENHYRVPWFPLLPKSIGKKYLSVIGRDSNFLEEYVFYTTYPQIWKIAKKIGFKNKTYKTIGNKAKNLNKIKSTKRKIMGSFLRVFPSRIRSKIAVIGAHALGIITSGVQLHLKKEGID